MLDEGGNSIMNGLGVKLTYLAAVASSYFALTSNNSDCTFSKARREKEKPLNIKKIITSTLTLILIISHLNLKYCYSW